MKIFQNELPNLYSTCIVKRNTTNKLGMTNLVYAWLSWNEKDDKYYWNVDTFNDTYCFEAEPNDMWDYVKK